MKRKEPDPDQFRPGVPAITKLEDEPPGYDSENPWAADKLERNDYARTLTSYIQGIRQPYVMAISAGWGQGKSVFLRMWGDMLKNDNKHCILFNAWESDFGEDPLVALMGALTDYANECTRRLQGEVQAGLQRTLGAAKESLATIWRNKTDVAASFISSQTGIDAEKALARAGKERFDAYEDQRDAMVRFRKQLEAAAQSLSVDGFPLMIMIDELDRCRPDYAVLFLERIKHLFSVSGVVFVLAIEERQLCRTISALYGLDPEGARAYLRRFLDMEYSLPEPSREYFAGYLLAQFNIDEIPYDSIDMHTDVASGKVEFDLLPVFIQLAQAANLSLRDMAQVAARTAAIVRSYSANRIEAALCLSFTTFRLNMPDLYYKLKKGKSSWRPFMDSASEADRTTLRSLMPEARIFLETSFNYFGHANRPWRDWMSSKTKEASEAKNEEDARWSAKSFEIANLIEALKPSKEKIVEMVEFSAGFDVTGTSSLGLELSAVKGGSDSSQGE